MVWHLGASSKVEHATHRKAKALADRDRLHLGYRQAPQGSGPCVLRIPTQAYLLFISELYKAMTTKIID